MLAAGIGATAMVLTGCAAEAGPDGTDAEAPGSLDSVNIVVPADPGGGWDGLGRAMQNVYTDDGILSSAPVTNIGGAGGTIGLASINEQPANTLFVTGLRHCFGLGRSGRSKVLPMMLLALMLLPALILVGVLVQARQLLGLDSHIVPYSRYPLTTSLLISVFVAAQAPALISRDLRFRTITLYLARPMRRTTYVLARLASPCFARDAGLRHAALHRLLRQQPLPHQCLANAHLFAVRSLKAVGNKDPVYTILTEHRRDLFSELHSNSVRFCIAFGQPERQIWVKLSLGK